MSEQKWIIKDIGGLIINNTLLAWHDKQDVNEMFDAFVQKSDCSYFQCNGRRYKVSEDRSTFEDVGESISEWHQ